MDDHPLLPSIKPRTPDTRSAVSHIMSMPTYGHITPFLNNTIATTKSGESSSKDHAKLALDFGSNSSVPNLFNSAQKPDRTRAKNSTEKTGAMVVTAVPLSKTFTNESANNTPSGSKSHLFPSLTVKHKKNTAPSSLQNSNNNLTQSPSSSLGNSLQTIELNPGTRSPRSPRSPRFGKSKTLGRDTIDSEFGVYGGGSLSNSQTTSMVDTSVISGISISQTKSYDGGAMPTVAIESESPASQTNSYNSNSDFLIPSSNNLEALEVHGNVKANVAGRDIGTATPSSISAKREKSIKLWRPGGLSTEKTEMMKLNAIKMKELNERIRHGLRTGGKDTRPKETLSTSGGQDHPKPLEESSELLAQPSRQLLLKGKKTKRKPGSIEPQQVVDSNSEQNDEFSKNNSSTGAVVVVASSPPLNVLESQNGISEADPGKDDAQQKIYSKKEESAIMQFVKFIDSFVSSVEGTSNEGSSSKTPRPSDSSSVIDVVTCETNVADSIPSPSNEISAATSLKLVGRLHPLIKVPESVKEKGHRHIAFIQNIKETVSQKTDELIDMEPTLTARQLEIQFMQDYTFMEKRAIDMHINFINQHNRDLNVFGTIVIETVSWNTLKAMIYNYFLYHKSIAEPLVNADLAQMIVEVMEQDWDTDKKIAEKLKDIMNSIPQNYALELKINFKHLVRMATVLTDIPAPLYSSMAHFFANLMFRTPSRQNLTYQQELRLLSKQEKQETDSLKPASTRITISVPRDGGMSDSGKQSPRITPNNLGSSASLKNIHSESRSVPSSPSFNSIRNSQRESRNNPKVKGLWQELPDSQSPSLRPSSSFHDLNLDQSTQPAAGAAVTSSNAPPLSPLSIITSQNIPGFRNSTMELKIAQPPSIIEVPANSPFFPHKTFETGTENSDSSDMEAEFDQWFLGKVDKERNASNAMARKKFKENERARKKEKLREKLELQEKLEKRKLKEKEKLQERARFLWGKVRHWVNHMGVKRLTDKMREGYKAIENEIASTRDAAESYERAIIISEDLREDLDGFGFSWVRKDDIESKIFLEQSCHTAISAALAIILENLDSIFD